jgi:Fe-S cluster assembly iron-binding protein IscA
MGEEAPFVHLNPETVRELRSFLIAQQIQKPIRIDLSFKGCCDATLELRVDHVQEHDIRIDIKGLTFVMSQEVYKLTGEVTISHVNEKDRKGFRVSSIKPVSEWGGLGVCQIQT